MTDICPLCGESLAGEDGTMPYLVGREEPGIYDGILYWSCLHCGARWHRFPPEHPMRGRAAEFVGAP